MREKEREGGERQRKEREKLIKKWSRETETEGMEDREGEREREARRH